MYEKYKRTILVAVTQDSHNNILRIVFVIIEGETVKAWFFFLQNLQRYVTLQASVSFLIATN